MSICKTIPSEKSTPHLLVVELPIENAPTPPKAPTEVVSLQSPESDIHPEITDIICEARPLPPSEFSPTMSSVGQEIKVEHLEVTTPPLGIVSSETSLVLTVSTTEFSEFVMGDLPVSEEGLQSPGPLATTESSPSPSIHPSQWRTKTDISYDSSQLLPTPLM